MKSKLFFIAALLFFVSINSYSQAKIGYVDSDAIMDQLPDAQDARQQIDALVNEWQSEIKKLEGEWKTKYDDYEKRKLIMSDIVRAETESELIKLEQKIVEYREKKFGTNGELFQKQDELMKPIQNKVFTIIKKVAEEEELDFVFDKSGQIAILYAKEKFDITNKVLQLLKKQ
ncbi:MAG: OmpH family outer membrane protein [Ignavibacteria bacterium]|nr:OmpH family outer membrane protein [Ignavibacteria bacterium]